MRSIPYNFYAIIAVIMVFFVIKKDINLKPIGEYKAREFIANNQAKTKANLYDMLLPIGVLVLLVPVGLYITGKGDIFQGSGSTSVYYAVVISLLFMYLFFVPRKKLSHKGYFEAFYKGLSDMLPLGIIMILAFLIGKVIGNLDTAGYLSSLVSESIPPILIPMLIFLISAITAFATGTSWGTFSVMMPISLAMGADMGLDIPLMIGAVISGGVFGDHASPISDTTIISATATGCEPIDHVRTQLPYALIAGALAAVAFLVAGAL
jgi:Na+/H+ antiporter NhaC